MTSGASEFVATSPRGFLRGGAAAVMLLTRVRVSLRLRPADWSWASAWFPIVGAGLGVFVAGLWWLARPLGNWPAAILTIAATVVLTGALHEDGLADTADALGATDDRDKVFAILKDSRIGTYGALALTLALMLRASLLVEIGAAAPAALVVAHSLSRVSPAVMVSFIPYVTPADIAKSRTATRSHPAAAYIAVIAMAVIIAALCAVGWLRVSEAALALAVAASATLLLGRYFIRRVGGMTGDFLGATQQIVECGVLVVFVF